MAVEGVDEVADDGLIGIAVVGQLQAEQGIADLLGTDVQGLAVEIGAPTLPGIEALVGTDLVDHAQQYLAPLQECDAHGIGGILVDEVGGAVERIDHPEHLLGIVAGKSFLGDESRLGQQFAQRTDNQLFGTFIDIRHIIVGMLALHALERELTALLADIGACPAGYLADGFYAVKIFVVHHLLWFGGEDHRPAIEVAAYEIAEHLADVNDEDGRLEGWRHKEIEGIGYRVGKAAEDEHGDTQHQRQHLSLAGELDGGGHDKAATDGQQKTGERSLGQTPGEDLGGRLYAVGLGIGDEPGREQAADDA